MRYVGALVLGPNVEEMMRGIKLFRVGRPSFLRSEATLIWRITSSLAPGPLDALSHLLPVTTACADQSRRTELEGPHVLLNVTSIVVLTHINATERRLS